jgi:hypothetical protein
VLPTLSRIFSPGLQKNSATEKKIKHPGKFTCFKGICALKKNYLCIFLLEN